MLCKNDSGKLNPVANFMFNASSLSYAKGLKEATESIIADVWQCIKMYDDQKIPLPPTAAFKCRSLISFAAVSELMALVLPKSIKVSVAKVLQQSNFNEFYCVCGCVSAQEQYFLFHIRSCHLVIHKLFTHLKYTHMPISQIDFSEIANTLDRSDLLGTMDQQ